MPRRGVPVTFLEAQMDDFGQYDAVGLAELVRSRQVTQLELVDETIERIERLNPQLNAVVIKMYEYARELAKNDTAKGPFAGVPFLLKDFLGQFSGVEYSQSSRFLSGFVPDKAAVLTQRFKRAGFITVGKTNLPEFAIGATTEPEFRGATHNPWDLERTPGGSSGGAGASVASRIVPAAHGNAAGGSIRIPAAACGTVGLKPTRGRNPLGPDYGDLISGFVAEHVLTRTVRDTAAILDVTSGPDAGDWYPAPTKSSSFLKDCDADPGQLKIAVSVASPTGTPVHPDCIAAVHDIAALCEDLGHHVVEAAPSYNADALWYNFTSMMSVGVAWMVDAWTERLGREAVDDELEPFIKALAAHGRTITGPNYLAMLQELQVLARDIGRFFQDHHVLLTPTLGEPAIPLGVLKYDSGDPLELRKSQGKFAPFTYMTNVTGQPAITLPLAMSQNNLPIGLHFAGRYGDESTLFKLSTQLEQARPWLDRVPPVSA